MFGYSNDDALWMWLSFFPAWYPTLCSCTIWTSSAHRTVILRANTLMRTTALTSRFSYSAHIQSELTLQNSYKHVWTSFAKANPNASGVFSYHLYGWCVVRYALRSEFLLTFPVLFHYIHRWFIFLRELFLVKMKL